MNCKYFKKRTKKNIPYFYCTLNRQIIDFNACKSCCTKEYKTSLKSPLNKEKKVYKIKSKTSKLSKLEKHRFSIITTDLEHCILCGKPKEHLHELVFGKNRLNSIKYGLVVPVCLECHQLMHNTPYLQKNGILLRKLNLKKHIKKSLLTYFI